MVARYVLYGLQWLVAYLAGALGQPLWRAEEYVAFGVVIFVLASAFYALDAWRRAHP